MTSVERCTECGADLSRSFQAGLCQQCLLLLGLDSALGNPAGISSGDGEPGQASTPDSRGVLEGAGATVGRYKLLEEIGQGGFGVVYMAEQTDPIRRKVALKIIKAGMDTREVVARFEAERQALALMDHPNIARVLDAGSTPAGRPYFVMELVHGILINEYCDQRTLATSERLRLFLQVCQAVQHAHQKGLIHRDLKPSNILVTHHESKPVPKVIDFGVAKALDQKLTERTLFTGFLRMVGTPAYMSPEQAEYTGMDVDTRADIYALGVLLYELLTGVTPFDAETFRKAGLDELRRMIREIEPLKPSTRLRNLGDRLADVAKHRRLEPPRLIHRLRGDLDWIVMKCLEKDRRRRYETVNGLVRDIERHLSEEPIEARSPSKFYKVCKFARRNRLILSAAVVVLGFLVAGVAVSYLLIAKERDASRQSAARESAAAAEARRQGLESRKRLANAHFSTGWRFADSGDIVRGLPWLIEALRLEMGDPRRAWQHRVFLASLLNQAPRLERFWFHEGPVNSVRFSPDGRRVASAGDDGVVQVWDVASGQSALPARPHWASSPDGSFDTPMMGSVRKVRYSPDGRWLVSVGGAHVRLWDAKTGALGPGEWRHDRQVWHAEFSVDSQEVLTAGADGLVQIWSVSTGDLIGEPLRHPWDVYHIALSPDGRWLATACRDSKVRVWNLETRLFSERQPETWTQGGEALFTAFSKDNRYLAAASLDGRCIAYDLTQSNESNGHRLSPALLHGRAVLCADFAPDARRLATASADGNVRLWSLPELQAQPPLIWHQDVVPIAVFNQDGSQLLTASADNTARVWDSETHEPVSTPLWSNHAINDAAFGPDGNTVITAGADGGIRLWRLPASQPQAEISRAMPTARFVAFSARGDTVFVTDFSHSNHVWNIATEREMTISLVAKRWVDQAAFSPDGMRLLTVDEHGEQRLWNLGDGTSVVAPWAPHQCRVAPRFSNNGLRVITGSNLNIARVWDVVTGRLFALPQKSRGALTCVGISQDGRLAAFGTDEFKARVWDVETGAVLSPTLSHRGAVVLIGFTPDNARLVTAARDGSVQAWDYMVGQRAGPILAHSQPITQVLFPLGHEDTLITVCEDRTVRWWNLRTGQQLTTPMRQNRLIRFARLNENEGQVLTIDDRLEVRIWDLSSGRPLTAAPRYARWSEETGRPANGVDDWWPQLEPDDRPWEELYRVVSLLSGKRVDPSGELTPLTRNELRAAAAIQGMPVR